MKKTIAVAAITESCFDKARLLAKQLQLEFTTIDNKLLEFLLVVTPSHLELRQINSTAGPLQIDFIQGEIGYRLKRKGPKELIAKAVGLKANEKLYVIDATAGLGRDGFLLATLGCKILMLERSKVIAALLQDGLQRALAATDFAKLDIQLQTVDAKEYLINLAEEDYPDVIYLDPMYPDRDKLALVKKEMRYLQTLLGKDEDIEKLLEVALLRAKKRVVIKRPVFAATVAGLQPHHVIKGKNTRFDIYQSITA